MTPADEISFVQEQAKMTRQQAMRNKEQHIRDMQVAIPIVFDSKQDYIRKLLELIETEAEIDRLNTEVVAEAGVSFVFKERLEIYCKIEMQVPKTNQQFIREHTILTVVIPIKVPEGRIPQYYHGTGTIKKVVIKPNDRFLKVTF